MKHELFVFPDYRRANPYQKLMYDFVDSIFNVQFGQIERASVLLRNGGLGRHVLFHLHWEDAVYRHAPDEATAWNQVQSFLTELEHFADAGGRILWTVHNKEPHDDPYPAIHPVFREKLITLADCIHVHGSSAARWLVTAWGIEPEKIAIVPHGNYSPIYKPLEQTKNDLRSPLGLSEQDRVFLLFGRLGAYKGAADLIEAFADIGDPQSHLIIAGKPVPPMNGTDASAPDSQSERVIYRPEFVDEAELVRLFQLADFVVLPYKTTLTSGTLLLAFSMVKPVILPDAPGFLDVVNDGVNSIVYKGDQPEALTKALQYAAALPDETVLALGQAALATAEGYDWRFLGASMSGVLHRLIALERPHRRLDVF